MQVGRPSTATPAFSVTSKFSSPWIANSEEMAALGQWETDWKEAVASSGLLGSAGLRSD